MRLVLLPLLDGALLRVEVLVAREALHGLAREVAVGHRVPEDGDALAGLAQEGGDPARRLALAGAGTHGADGDRRLGRGEHRVGGRDQLVGGARRQRARADVHDVLVRHVGVGEDDLVHLVLAHDPLQLRLREDRDALLVAGPGERGRIDAAVDVRDLRRRERDHLGVVAAAVDDVEVVEVAARGSRDQHSSLGHARSIGSRGRRHAGDRCAVFVRDEPRRARPVRLKTGARPRFFGQREQFRRLRGCCARVTSLALAQSCHTRHGRPGRERCLDAPWPVGAGGRAGACDCPISTGLRRTGVCRALGRPRSSVSRRTGAVGTRGLDSTVLAGRAPAASRRHAGREPAAARAFAGAGASRAARGCGR